MKSRFDDIIDEINAMELDDMLKITPDQTSYQGLRNRMIACGFSKEQYRFVQTVRMLYVIRVG